MNSTPWLSTSPTAFSSARFYLKVDDSYRSQYEAEGMTAFQPYSGKPVSMTCYQLPARVSKTVTR